MEAVKEGMKRSKEEQLEREEYEEVMVLECN